jgi:RNA polymerase sigma-70 factor (ECF subfamily)
MAHIEQLVQAHQGHLLRYLRWLGCDDSLAADMAQECFVKIIQGDPQLENPHAMAAYLRTTARNFYLMHLRRERRNVSLPDPDVLEAAWAENEGDDFGEGYRRALQQCLQGLTERARLALSLRFGQGASREQISVATGLDPEGTKTLLRRAKAKLKLCIENKVGNGRSELAANGRD